MLNQDGMQFELSAIQFILINEKFLIVKSEPNKPEQTSMSTPLSFVEPVKYGALNYELF